MFRLLSEPGKQRSASPANKKMVPSHSCSATCQVHPSLYALRPLGRTARVGLSTFVPLAQIMAGLLSLFMDANLLFTSPAFGDVIRKPWWRHSLLQLAGLQFPSGKCVAQPPSAVGASHQPAHSSNLPLVGNRMYPCVFHVLSPFLIRHIRSHCFIYFFIFVSCSELTYSAM